MNHLEVTLASKIRRLQNLYNRISVESGYREQVMDNTYMVNDLWNYSIGGGAEIYILDMSDTSVPLSVYRASIRDYAEEVGVVSFADYDVFVMEVGGGFFWDGGAKITLK